MQAAPGQLGNRRKPLTQIRLERLQLRHSGRAGTINRRLETTGDDLAHRLAVQPGAPGDGRNAGALPMQIEDHDNLSQSGHPLPSIPEREASAQSADRPPRDRRRYVSPPGEFSIGTFGEFSSGADSRELVATMMRRMGIEALYRRPNTSKPADGHRIYPYLLRNLAVERPNQVWAMDITYIPMARGFVYLAAVVDWFSRRVLAWRLSITLEVEFCLEAVEEALARYGRPKIFNTDQGSQFTSAAFTACYWRTRSRSAWMAAVRGATMSLSSGCGGRSNTRRSTCTPTTVSVKHAFRSGGTCISTIASGRIRALLPERRIVPTSITCRCSRQPEFRRRCRDITPVGLRPPA